MCSMNPFDQPPAGAPVSVDAPDPMPERPRRGRTALVAVLTLGLVGGGVAGVSQLASADRPDLGESAQADPTDDTIAPADEKSADQEPAGEPAEEPADPNEGSDPVTEGQVVIDTGDGDPVVIDLGDLEMGRIGDLSECIGLPTFDLDGPFGEFTPGDFSSEDFPFDLEELDEFLGELPFDLEALDELGGDWTFDVGEGDAPRIFDVGGGTVTVAGPDGVQVVDLGENGSVTVTTDDGEVTVTTGGDATVSELDDLLGEFGTIFEGLPELFDDEAIADFAESLPAFEDWPEFEDWPAFETIDPDAVQSCIDEVLGD